MELLQHNTNQHIIRNNNGDTSTESSGRGSSSSGSGKERSWTVPTSSPSSLNSSSTSHGGVAVIKKPFSSHSELARESPDEGIQTDSGTDVWRRRLSARILGFKLCVDREDFFDPWSWCLNTLPYQNQMRLCFHNTYLKIHFHNLKSSIEL